MDLKNLQEIFERNNEFFRIPAYQRGYSWENEQLEDLWRDIEILEQDKYHYTGVLSVRKEKGNILVVDGQQRITSLIILIRAICKHADGANRKQLSGQVIEDYVVKYLYRLQGGQGQIEEPVFGYEKDNPSHVHFQKKILGLSDMESDVPSRTLYTRNLDDAMEFFNSKLRDMSLDDMGLLLAKVTRSLKFNYYLMNDELNEFVVFESMNNRGKPLSVLELLKNRLIYLVTLLPPSEADVQEKDALCKAVNDAWKTVYEYLGKSQEKALNDDDFLRDHWIMTFPYNRDESRVYKKTLLNQHFTAERVRSGALKYSDIKEYAKDIQNAVRPFYYIHYPQESAQESGYSKEVQKWLSKMKRLRFGAFRPLLMSILMHEDNDSKIINFLEAAERFLFVAFNVHFHRADHKNNHIYHAAREHHVENQRNLDTLTSDLWKARKCPCEFSLKKFMDKVQEKKKGFYGWKAIKYFLYEYELYLTEQGGGQKKQDYVIDDTLEHIFPQNPGEGWEHFDAPDLLHDLGNLLFLSKKHNSEIGNRSFADKQAGVYHHASYSSIKVSRYSDWTPESVEHRRKDMLNFLVEWWNLTSTDSPKNQSGEK